jgi:beta-glucosidase
VNAGLDLFMAPDSWQGLYQSTLADVRSGAISMERLDEAVSRILRVKMRARVFEAGRPSSRTHAGNFSLLAAPQHRAIARRAVRESLVLLKNENGLLPLSPGMKVLITGDGADNIGKQSGGWTLSWQGTGNLNAHFPNGTSIYAGLRAAFIEQTGGIEMSVDGGYESKPDVAIVVFGEDPYAEGVGDRDSVDYVPRDGLQLLRKFKAAGIPTVSVFLSGRPLWVNPELNASDAFVAAWLPGTEGAGIADVLIANADGSPRFDFNGRLSFSWPHAPDQVSVNVSDAEYDPLFAYGYGLDYEAGGTVGFLPEDDETDPESQFSLIEFGDPVGAWELLLRDDNGQVSLEDSRGVSSNETVIAQAADDEVQEDSLVLTWTGRAEFLVSGGALDLGVAAAGERSLEIRYRVLRATAKSIVLSVDAGDIDITTAIESHAGGTWQTASIDLACFAARGAQLTSITEPFALTVDGPLALQIGSARFVTGGTGKDCDF